MERFILGALVAALMAGCGGGGSSSAGTGGSANPGAITNTVPDPIITAAFEPKEGQATIFENQSYFNTNNEPQYLLAALNADGIDATKVFPVIAADRPIFSQVSTGVSPISRKVEILARPSTQLSAGTYTGQLTVTLYKDAAKTQAHTLSNGGVFRYTVNVDPELVITVKIDGIVQARRVSSSNTGVMLINGNTIYWKETPTQAAFRLKPGQVLELTSSIPVTWHGPDSWYPYGTLWQAPVQTDTTFRQVTMPLQNIPSMSNTAIVAMPKSVSKQWGAGFTVDVFP